MKPKLFVAIMLVVIFSLFSLFFLFFGCANPAADAISASAASESATVVEVRDESEVEREPVSEANPDIESDEIPLDENSNNVDGAAEEATEVVNEEEPAEPEVNEPETDAVPEAAEDDERYSHPRVRPEHFYDSFDEIDTSKLEVCTGVIVNGKEYIWLTEAMDGTINGFIEAKSSNGQHIVANIGPLSGNIIGY